MDSAQLRAARGLLNLTQAKLSEIAKVAERTLWLFERDEREPRQETLDKIQASLESLGVEFFQSEVGRGVFLRFARTHDVSE